VSDRSKIAINETVNSSGTLFASISAGDPVVNIDGAGTTHTPAAVLAARYCCDTFVVEALHDAPPYRKFALVSR